MVCFEINENVHPHVHTHSVASSQKKQAFFPPYKIQDHLFACSTFSLNFFLLVPIVVVIFSNVCRDNIVFFFYLLFSL